MKRKLFLSGCLLVITVLGAQAAPGNYVLRIDGPRVYLDYGSGDGAVEGESISVYRIDTVTHPVTGRQMESRILLERNARILSAGRDTSVILLPDSEVYEGMRVELEKPRVSFPAKHEEKSGLSFSGEYISFSGSDTLGFAEAGYIYSSGRLGIEAGAGMADGRVREYYYGYAEPCIYAGNFSVSARVMPGVTEDGADLGYGGAIRAGAGLGPFLSGAYRYYPTLGPSAHIEAGTVREGFLSPSLRIGWAEIPDNDGGMTVQAGAGLRVSDSLRVNILAGVGARDTDDTGFAGSLGAEVFF